MLSSIGTFQSEEHHRLTVFLFPMFDTTHNAENDTDVIILLIGDLVFTYIIVSEDILKGHAEYFKLPCLVVEIGICGFNLFDFLLNIPILRAVIKVFLMSISLFLRPVLRRLVDSLILLDSFLGCF